MTDTSAKAQQLKMIDIVIGVSLYSVLAINEKLVAHFKNSEFPEYEKPWMSIEDAGVDISSFDGSDQFEFSEILYYDPTYIKGDMIYQVDMRNLALRKDPRIHILLKKYNLISDELNQIIQVPNYHDLIIVSQDVGPECVSRSVEYWYYIPSKDS